MSALSNGIAFVDIVSFVVRVIGVVILFYITNVFVCHSRLLFVRLPYRQSYICALPQQDFRLFRFFIGPLFVFLS